MQVIPAIEWVKCLPMELRWVCGDHIWTERALGCIDMDLYAMRIGDWRLTSKILPVRGIPIFVNPYRSHPDLFQVLLEVFNQRKCPCTVR